MPRIRLLHWKASEAAPHIQTLRRAKHRVEYDEQFQTALMKNWRESPPDAFVIDLSRLPSHGREIAIALRQSPRTRQIPIVFCDGAEEKVQRIRSELPDAAYCTLSNLVPTLRSALAGPPADPVKPVQMMDRYGSRTTAQKLGIKESSIVAVIDGPRDLEQILGRLPAGVELKEYASDSLKMATADSVPVTLCFVHNASSLTSTLSEVRRFAAIGKLWILWRKGGSAARGNLTEWMVREGGIDLGLVDYKICSVNKIWSGMLFARKH